MFRLLLGEESWIEERQRTNRLIYVTSLVFGQDVENVKF